MRPASRGALHLDDVLARRTHITVEALNRSLMAAKGVAELAGDVLSWDNVRCELEIVHYVAQVEADRLAAQELIDATGVAARGPILDRFGA